MKKINDLISAPFLYEAKIKVERIQLNLKILKNRMNKSKEDVSTVCEVDISRRLAELDTSHSSRILQLTTVTSVMRA